MGTHVQPVEKVIDVQLVSIMIVKEVYRIQLATAEIIHHIWCKVICKI